jgi:hypothetical protein
MTELVTGFVLLSLFAYYVGDQIGKRVNAKIQELPRVVRPSRSAHGDLTQGRAEHSAGWCKVTIRVVR